MDAIRVIECYISHLPKPDNWWNKAFEQRCISLWAAKEILALVKERPDKAITIVEEFRDKMDDYSTYNLQTSFRFSVAKDVAEDICDQLYFRR